ncbi:MAG: hypothetical protein ACD_75C00662G0001, partial [uncultured bacterium]
MSVRVRKKETGPEAPLSAVFRVALSQQKFGPGGACRPKINRDADPSGLARSRGKFSAGSRCSSLSTTWKPRSVSRRPTS